MPRVSVVVRSYNRLPALCGLLEQLLAQRHDSFEVIVVEQSTQVAPEDAARLGVIERDARLRVLRHPPLGGPRARNVGVGAARGDIVLLIDDDDLPVGDGWIAAHEACYQDPMCLGVTGRHVDGPVGGGAARRPSAAYAWLARRRCMRFSWLLRFPGTYSRHLERVAPVDYVHGTNGSIRRAAFERFGGWDEDTRVEDESSFGFRVQRGKQRGEYLAFDPRPVVQRGLEVPGGLAKRYISAGEWFARLIDFVHNIIARYHRARVVLLYPLYVTTVVLWTLRWIWDESNRYRTFAQRAGGSLMLLAATPVYVVRAWGRARRK